MFSVCNGLDSGVLDSVNYDCYTMNRREIRSVLIVWIIEVRKIEET